MQEIFEGCGDHVGGVYTSLNSFGRYMIGPEAMQLNMKVTAPDSIYFDLQKIR